MVRSPKRGTPWLHNPPKASYVGPFRTNLLEFLEQFATLQSRRSRNRLWTVPLSFSDSSSKLSNLELYVFEQRMILEHDVVICDNSRVAGAYGASS